MLRFTKIDCRRFYGDTAQDLFTQNTTVIFEINAPMYWWIDTDWIKYYLNMPLSDFEFCQDAWCGYSQFMIDQQLAAQNPNLSPRALMQILPLSTMVKATIELSYQEIVEICENYVAGEYYYSKGYGFPNDREWADFCETLLDIKGIRDLIKEYN